MQLQTLVQVAVVVLVGLDQVLLEATVQVAL
jgi:hypothetical protein